MGITPQKYSSSSSEIPRILSSRTLHLIQTHDTMAWSKSNRISVMLAIDTAFFLLELGVGMVVGSLALTADAFHMLNDIISLLVGLWAVKAAQKPRSDKYSFGWLRAEILGAFFNAVFLIALCLSIILEAITRLLDPPEISNSKLILIVGSLGLTSNLAGFFVLRGHSHGETEHDDAVDDVRAVEEGYSGHAGAIEAEYSVTPSQVRVRIYTDDEAVNSEASWMGACILQASDKELFTPASLLQVDLGLPLFWTSSKTIPLKSLPKLLHL